MAAVLGISAYYHDAAAALVVDGEIVAAAQEERFTRVKHDASFPSNAIGYCLDEAGLAPEDLDAVGFYEKPFLKLDRLLETYLAFAPRGFRQFVRFAPAWTREKLRLPREIARGLGGSYRKPIVFAEHHESHAASAFFPSPFEEAAILTMDGVGEWATTTYGTGRGNRVELTHEIRFPHSLGLLYSAFTYFTGFRVNSGEYKLMGLAPYGEPSYADRIREHLIDLKDDGSFRLDLSYFRYCEGLRMTSPKFDALFGGPPRAPETPITQREMDIAASIQAVTEEAMLRTARHVHAETGMRKLCLAGGVALNCVANGRILREGPFDDIWIQPAAGDAGGALGVALFIWHQLLGHPRTVQVQDAQQGSFLGPHWSDDEIQVFLDGVGAPRDDYADDQALCEAVAELIAAGQVVGWFQGRMEFGPRALGSRSILGDPRDPRMQSRMNLQIKFRESFRPFAPAVLRDRCSGLLRAAPGRRPSLHVDCRAGCRAAANAGERRRPAGVRPSARGPLRRTSRDACRLFGPPADGRCCAPWPVRHPAADLRGEDRLPGHGQHQLQRPGRANRPDARRRLALLHGDRHGRAGAGPVRPAEGTAAGGCAGRRGRAPRPASRWTDAMSHFRVNRNPSPRELRWFGLLLPLFIALVGAIARWQFGAPAAALGIWSAGGALAALYWVAPLAPAPDPGRLDV